MKRSILVIATIALAALALTGCGRVVGLVFEPDLTIDYVNVIRFNEEFAGLEVAFENDGVWVNDVEYVVVLSEDEFLDMSDHIAYSDDFDIGFKGWEDTQVQRAYMDTAGLPDGDYHIGVIVDPYDEIDEAGENDNTLAALEAVFIGDGAGGGPTVLFPDGWEDNDFFNNARTFNKYVWHSANLHEGPDEDWYSVDRMASIPLTIIVRPGPNGIDVPVTLDIYYEWDGAQTSPVATLGPNVDHRFTIPDEPFSEWYHFRIRSDAGELGEYEFRAEDNY